MDPDEHRFVPAEYTTFPLTEQQFMIMRAAKVVLERIQIYSETTGKVYELKPSEIHILHEALAISGEHAVDDGEDEDE